MNDENPATVTAPEGPTTVHWLASGEWRDVRETVAVKAWAELAKLAWPHLESYHSDLAHDLDVLRETLKRDTAGGHHTWYFAVDSHGTQLTLTRETAELRAGKQGHLWVVSLEPERRGPWSAATWRLAVSYDATWRELER